MKYKVGDKVKIKTWERLVKEFGIDPYDENLIECKNGFLKGRDEFLTTLNNGRIVTIKEISEEKSYTIKEGSYSLGYWSNFWGDDMIECSLAELKEIEKTYIPVNSRWELLDL